MLAEVSTTKISKKESPKGLSENLKVAKKGAAIAGKARREIEEKTGKPAITGRNAKDLKLIEKKKI